MPVVLEAIDLDKVFDDEDLLIGWVRKSVEEGRVFAGYSGNIYSHKEYGKAEIYSSLVINDADKKVELNGFDIQVSGRSVWNVHYLDMPLKNDDPHNMTRLCGVKSRKTGGFTIMHLINADVLPSFLENDVIQAQVIAYALNVNYYENEKAFSDTIPECEGMQCEELNGHKIIPAMGSVLPNGFMHGHLVEEEGTCKQDDSDDDIVAITGIVKAVFVKTVELEGEPISKFIVTRLDTEFGELDLVHSRAMITDEEASIVKEGAVVQAVAVLSADAAVFEYENGIVRDARNDLAALRYAFIKGNASRLKTIMSDDVIYESVNAEAVVVGKENVINHINYIHENTKTEYFSHFATLENINPGERCIILAQGEEDNLTDIVRIEVNDDGLITKITITKDPAIKFKIDEKPQYDNIWDEE